MKHIIDTPYGEITICRLIDDYLGSFNFFFELENVAPSIEDKLKDGIKVAKEEKFREISKYFPDRFKNVGYENADQIPERVVFTVLDLKFSDKGKGLEHSKIGRGIVDALDGNICNFEVETSFPIDLSEQIDDLKQLALTYLEKIMFQKRTVENYII